MEESLGLGKKSYGTETDTETQSWFPSYSNHIILISVHFYFFFFFPALEALLWKI